jgi:hypothetical protein
MYLDTMVAQTVQESSNILQTIVDCLQQLSKPQFKQSCYVDHSQVHCMVTQQSISQYKVLTSIRLTPAQPVSIIQFTHLYAWQFNATLIDSDLVTTKRRKIASLEFN